jgi:hypothetical protein
MTFLATCGLVYVAWRGLGALRLAKADIGLRNERETKACAIARCEEFAGEIITESSKVMEGWRAEGIGTFVKSGDEVQFDPDNKSLLAAAGAWHDKVSGPLDWQVKRFLNRLEAWSMHFTTGVADHNIAFGPLAPPFCNMVVRYYAFLLTSRASAASGKFPNLVKLFQAWNGLLEEEKRGLKAEDLIKQLNALNAKSRAPIDPLPALGKNIDTKP